MRSLLRTAVTTGLRHLSPVRLAAMADANPLCLVYHTVFDEAPEHFSGLYRTRTVREFEDDLDELLRDFRPISLFDITDSLSSHAVPANSFLLTFDDNNREIAEVIAPILERKGIPAVFFLCSAMLDNAAWFFEDQVALLIKKCKASGTVQSLVESILKNTNQTLDCLLHGRQPRPELLKEAGDRVGIDWNAELQARQPYVSKAQVGKLIDQGFAIGAHGIDHRFFETMDANEQIRQIRESCDCMASTFGLKYRAFAFPYGEFGVSKSVLTTIQGQQIADILFGTRGPVRDEFHPFVVQRLWCENRTNSLTDYLKTHLADRVYQHLRGKTRVSRNA
ncbi:MAG: polysaccharide deacetylase family protein [Planctomycetaceae bacterium]